MIDLNAPITQTRFAELVGVTQPAIADFVRRGVLKDGAPLREWLLSYVGQLRDEAAGRSAGLIRERERLAREQADEKAMTNAVRRRELVPVAVLLKILAGVSARLASIFERVLPRIRREVGALDAQVARIIEQELANARNEAALLELPIEDIDGSLRDPAGDSQRPGAPAGAGADAALPMG